MIARTYLSYGRVLRRQYHFIHGALRRAETAVDGKGAGDIRGIAVQFRAGVYQQQIAVGEFGIVLGVMQDTAIGAAADDGIVGRPGGVAPKLMQQLRFDLILAHPRPGAAHGPLVRDGGDLRGAAHDLHLGGTFEQAQIMQHMFQGHELHGRVTATAGAGADAVHPAHDTLIEFGAVTHTVIDPLFILEEAGQDVIDIGDGKGIVGAIAVTHTVRSGAPPMPYFHHRIAFAAK